jgi:hypothetical protein
MGRTDNPPHTLSWTVTRKIATFRLIRAARCCVAGADSPRLGGLMQSSSHESARASRHGEDEQG